MHQYPADISVGKLYATAVALRSSGIDVRNQRVYVLIGHCAPGTDESQRAPGAGRGGRLPFY